MSQESSSPFIYFYTLKFKCLLGIYLNGADYLDERIALRLIGPDDGNLDPKHV